MNIEDATGEMTGQWVPSGHEMWTFRTADGYLGRAYWRVAGAAMTVTRPDGTELYKKVWGSRQIFPDAWPVMFEWLKEQVSEHLLADRGKRDQPEPPAAP
jgi:hypothetical protein